MSRFAVERLECRTLFSSYGAADVPQLLAAINAANASAGADTITLTAGKIFSLTAVNPSTTNSANGLPTIAAGGGSLTILGNGDTIERGSAIGTPGFRLLDVAAGASLTLRNLTLQNGLAAGEGFVSAPGTTTVVAFAPAKGGAIRSYGALSLDAVTIQNSTARGGASGTFFSTPLAGPPAMGGGIYSEGSLNLSGCTIQDNRAIGGGGFPAGANDGNQYSASRGTDGCGGGVYIAGGTASISGSTLNGNASIGGVGGDGLEYVGGHYAGSGGDGLGGGLFAAGGSIELRNSTVTLNVAQGGAAGQGPRTKTTGLPGKGVGGGLYIGVSASTGLDQFTKNHVTQNTATKKSDFDIFGKFSLIA